MLIWIKILRLLILNHLSLLFERSLLFEGIRSLIPMILSYFKPFYHNRLTTIIGKSVYVDNPYFSAIAIDDTITYWYKKLIS